MKQAIFHVPAIGSLVYTPLCVLTYPHNDRRCGVDDDVLVGAETSARSQAIHSRISNGR